MKILVLLASFGVSIAYGEIHEHPGGKELTHEKYLKVVSELDSPVQQVYIRTKDGLYVAAAVRKPKGAGPFPALIMFHGAPGGRGMEQIVGWSRGATGGPVWEKFLQLGYVVAVADYRGGLSGVASMSRPLSADQLSYVDDGLAVVDHVRSLSYVDAGRIHVYGVSLGGNLVLHLIGRTKVRAAIVGAPAPMSFLGASLPQSTAGQDRAELLKALKPDLDLARRNIEPISCPILILVGTADRLLSIDRVLYDLLEKAGKRVRMDIYANGYHDFCLGPQGQKRKEPLLDATLDALDVSIDFLKNAR